MEKNPLEDLILQIHKSNCHIPEEMVKNVVKQIGFKSNDLNSYKAVGLLAQHFLDTVIDDIDNLQNNRSRKTEDKKNLKKSKVSHQKCFSLKDLLEEFDEKGLDVYKVPYFPETDFQ